MNLKIEYNGFKLEIVNGDIEQVSKTIVSAFAFFEGGSFVEAYKNAEVEKRPVKSARNFLHPVDGVRTHENGTKEYKCSYFCPCGHNGVRYVLEDTTKTTCHKCKKELDVQPSTKNDLHDADFNYFVAY